MRIQSSRVIAAQMEALGAVPRVMTLAETREALETGWVEGTENTPSNMLSQNIYEVQPYATLSYHGYLGYAVIVNKAFWDGLPADVRKQLDEAMKEATDYANSIAKKDNDDALAAVKASGKTEIYTPTKAERDAFKKVLFPVHVDMQGRVGRDLLESIYTATGCNCIKQAGQ